jgi:FPC/CPF motif-containing protein YcgG
MSRPVDRPVESIAELMNPFDSPEALAHSNYCLFDGKRLLNGVATTIPFAMTAFVHDGFRALALNDHFTCVGAKAAVRQGGYRFGLYEVLGGEASSAGLARDLFTFTQERRSFQSEFVTFVASFAGPLPPDEAAFERLLWTTLQQLHDSDAPYHTWDPAVTADPADPRFSFSFAGTALFVVGLHAASSRASRRFAWPTLIFNPRDQFDRMRESGRYQRFQHVIREAERALQGDINPMLADFGERSEAPQYSGREVGGDWRCPFHANRENGDQRETEK